MSSSQHVDLKVSLFRDRNFKTPYYSNPYGYGKNVFKSSHSQVEKVSIIDSPTKTGGNRAFNLNTKTIFSPLANESPIREKKIAAKLVVNESILEKTKHNRNNLWLEAGKSSLSTIKDSVPRPFRVGPIKDRYHSHSVDMANTVPSKFNSTFTSGFGSTGLANNASNAFSKDADHNGSPTKKEFDRGYKKFKLSNVIPVYDFTGGNTPWINNVKVNNKINGKELNFKVNHSDYDKEFDSARPVAHTKGRKFCSMTRFMKSLEDNRIFQRWKMTTYRGIHG